MTYEDKKWRMMATGRTRSYDEIIGIFSTLPSGEFVEKIRGRNHRQFLERYETLGQPKIKKGVKLINRYVDRLSGTPEEIESLAVDRTRLLRVPQKEKLRPPYESQYIQKGAKKEALLIALGRAYHKGGFFPEKGVDGADFILIEMDFMRILTKEMAKETSSVKDILEQQRSFMNNHLGAWVPKYIEMAIPRAETEYYQGWLYFLDGFLEMEKALLGGVAQGG